MYLDIGHISTYLLLTMSNLYNQSKMLTNVHGKYLIIFFSICYVGLL